jgi:hypothetical protein
LTRGGAAPASRSGGACHRRSSAAASPRSFSSVYTAAGDPLAAALAIRFFASYSGLTRGAGASPLPPVARID